MNTRAWAAKWQAHRIIIPNWRRRGHSPVRGGLVTLTSGVTNCNGGVHVGRDAAAHDTPGFWNSAILSISREVTPPSATADYSTTNRNTRRVNSISRSPRLAIALLGLDRCN